MKIYLEVILPLYLPYTLTYSAEESLTSEIIIGKRVVVSLKTKFYTGIIYSVHPEPPARVEHIKDIEYIYDETPIVYPHQLVFWHWLSEYYMCSMGEVMSVALPNSLKLNSETLFSLVKDTYESQAWPDLSEKEKLLFALLENKSKVSGKEIQEYIQQKSIVTLIQKWMNLGVLRLQEDLTEKYTLKKSAFVELARNFSEEEISEIFKDLEKRSPKQLHILLHFIQLVQDPNWKNFSVHKSSLLKQSQASESALKSLEKKNIIKIVYKEESRLIVPLEEVIEIKTLNTLQQNAWQELHDAFEEKNVVLLHGVTSSGKTEVYIKEIELVIAQGKQVLFLLPEIALTTQMIQRLRKYFGEKIGVYHSRFNDKERAEIWHKQLSLLPHAIILGTRSSLFLPFQNLGLIIVDEEHEHSYKQASPAPRYNARDTAVLLARQMHAQVILGSATPSLESYYNAQTGKYALITMAERYHNTPLPNISLIDIKDLTRKKRMKTHFSDVLLGQIESTLAQKQKVILFQNRRGFALFMQCESCDFIEKCYQCDVSLTYHKQDNHLKCHYCGYTQAVEKACKGCGSYTLKIRGFGTEKVEEDLQTLFPNRNIARMDLDSTRGKNAFHQLIASFEKGDIDILVGTQMITKGLDFKNVGLVGVLNADNLIYFPDFRTTERSYQLMTQVAGRAGRNNQSAQVLIQTYTPNHPIFEKIISYDYLGLYHSECQERKKYHYPPFSRLIKITSRGKDDKSLELAAKKLVKKLKEHPHILVLGPEYPLIKRIKNWYAQEILIKVHKSDPLSESKPFILKTLREFFSQAEHKSLRYSIDVDPM